MRYLALLLFAYGCGGSDFTPKEDRYITLDPAPGTYKNGLIIKVDKREPVDGIPLQFFVKDEDGSYTTELESCVDGTIACLTIDRSSEITYFSKSILGESMEKTVKYEVLPDQNNFKLNEDTFQEQVTVCSVSQTPLGYDLNLKIKGRNDELIGFQNVVYVHSNMKVSNLGLIEANDAGLSGVRLIPSIETATFEPQTFLTQNSSCSFEIAEFSPGLSVSGTLSCSILNLVGESSSSLSQEITIPEFRWSCDRWLLD